MTQYKVLVSRYFKAYWRSPPYNTTRLLLSVIAGLIIGSFYWSRGNNYGSTADVLSVLGALFITVMFVGFINFQMVRCRCVLHLVVLMVSSVESAPSSLVVQWSP